jgi:hypothetical protein
VATDAFCVAVFAQQRVFGFLVMVERDFFPFNIVVTSFTLGAKSSFVFVILLVTVITKLGRIFEFVIQMASCAFNFFVFALQIKFRFAMVEMGRLPVFFLVAILALRPQPAFMFICLFVATVALGGCFPIFFLRGVAVLAKDFAIQVRAFQRKASRLVIKINGIQFYDAHIPAFVVGMAFFAWFLFLQQTVIAPLIGDILRHFLVTVFAQS